MRKILIFLLPTLLIAEEHSSHHVSIFVYWFNYLLFMVPVILLVKNKAIDAWVSRKNELSAQLNKGKELAENTQRKLEEVKKEYSALGDKLQTIQESHEKELNFELTEIQKNFDLQYQKNKDQVDSLLKSEKQSLLDEVKGKLSNILINKTKTKLLALDLKKINESYLSCVLKSLKLLD